MSAPPCRGLSACGLALLLLLPSGCKRSASPAAAGSASAGARAVPMTPEAEPSRCQKLPAHALTLEAAAPVAQKGRLVDGDAPEDDETLLPFGVDVGTAVPTKQGFAVAGLRGKGEAFLALLEAGAPRTLELGVLHGDAETPALAASGERVVVALRTSDAAGFALKLGQVARAQAGIEWGYEASHLGKEVTAITVALSGERGVVAYQGESKGGARIFLGSFQLGRLKDPFELELLAPKDVEMPRLVARPGGYWLAWVRSLSEAKKRGGAAEPEPDDPEERDLLEVGPRVVEVARLDEQGALQGDAVRIGEPRRQVLLFDVAAAASGSLLVAMRSDSAAPGAEGGAMVLSEVGADGSVREERLDDEEMGMGAPVLLVDTNAAVPEPWLTVSSPSDATRLGRAHGRRTLLEADPLIGRSEVLALSAGHFLTQRSRGRGAELAALSCRLGTQPSTPATSGQK